MARGSKPGERRGGRQKGTPNRLTADLKSAVLGALAAKGGQKYLEKVAEQDPRTFCTLLGKVLPLQLQGDPANPLTLHIVTGVPRTKEEADTLLSLNGRGSGATKPS